MDDLYSSFQLDELLKAVPGGVAKLAFDDLFTIVYASDTFYDLIKETKKKDNMQNPKELLRCVYSADIISVNQQIAIQKNRKDNALTLNFRTLQQDGNFKWVVISGNKSNEVHNSSGKTVPVYFCIAMEATELMNTQKLLKQQTDYSRIITDLSKELTFEYEIATDTLTFSEIFREVFGKEAKLTGFRDRLTKTKLIHQEELPSVIQIFNSMMSGRKLARFELRLIPKDGNSCWYICYASIIFDENKNPYKVIGKLATINKTHVVEVPPKAQLDTLTKICNKTSTEALITYAISKQEVDTLSAFFVINLKNFKAINELMEHMNGESVLKTLAGLLRGRFRSTDVIGRVAADEFIVYMKDIQSDKIVYEMAVQLCKEVEKLYTYEYSKNKVAISMGIAFSIGNQLTYQMLYTNASIALALAKKENSTSFEIFFGQERN